MHGSPFFEGITQIEMEGAAGRGRLPAFYAACDRREPALRGRRAQKTRGALDRSPGEGIGMMG
jgi:hypothetical protein